MSRLATSIVVTCDGSYRRGQVVPLKNIVDKAASQCPTLDGAKLANSFLLTGVFRLAWIVGDNGIARVNWRDMGAEELGSVYESLLELVPRVDLEARRFTFAAGDEAKGNARKTTGSYYTPDSLVQVLLDSALEPVVKDAIAAHPADPVAALLDLSVVDPACGSGHFLLAAARRLAGHVARLSANGTPSAAEYRHALRLVVGRCIYGVDLNPMAIELCKVSLWMEAVEPGLTLSFLDAHLQCGNALIGATPELMDKGVPDAAWEPLEGDDKRITGALKRRNKQGTKGLQMVFDTLWAKGAANDVAAVVEAVDALERSPDAQLPEVQQMASRWDEIRASEAYQHQRHVADLWCSAFVWPKLPGELANDAPTHSLWQQVREKRGAVTALAEKTTKELAEEYQFFHWHLAFPKVHARGGFDVVLGNPPWERVKLQEQEFFASRDAAIAGATNAAARKKLIADLPRNNRPLWDAWCNASRAAEGQSHFVRQSGRFPLCGKGDVNTYALFAEHNRALLGTRGRAGFIVPTGIATDSNTKEYFGSLIARKELSRLYGFENEEFVFPAVHHAFKFALLSLDRSGQTEKADLVFFARQVSALSDAERHFSLTPGDFAALNPNTRTCPTFRSRRDAELNLALYQRAGVLWREDNPEGNAWGLQFMRMFDMANDSGDFRTRAELETNGWKLEGNHFRQRELEMLPLVEAKMVHIFEHRLGTYEGISEAQSNQGVLPHLTPHQRANPWLFAMPEYWVDARQVQQRVASSGWTRRWFICFRDVARSVEFRTAIHALIPFAAVGHKAPIILPLDVEPAKACSLYAALNSFVYDYAARQKVGGASLALFIVKQLPVPPPAFFDGYCPWDRGTRIVEWILPRVLELTYTAWDLADFAADVGHHGPPFRWDAARRELLRAELDAGFFHLYGLSRADAAYVMETFTVAKKYDEKAHNEYRTRDQILRAYDALAERHNLRKSSGMSCAPVGAQRW